jgi:gliding motility-associated-like protein
MLVALDSISCTKMDTDYVDVYIGGPPVANFSPTDGICKGDSIQLNISGGNSYVWTPNYNILYDSTDAPIVWPDTTTMYTVITYDSCGTDTTNILVTVYHKNITINPGSTICLGDNIQLNVSGGGNYLWSPATSLNNPNIANPIATPLSNTTYNITITNSNLCIWDTSLTILIDSFPPNPQASVDDTICSGDTVTIYTSGNSEISWTPSNSLANPYDSITLAFPSQTTNYIVEATNACGVDYDSVFVKVLFINSGIVNDTNVCIGDRANIWASDGISYLWSSSENMPIITDSSFSSIIYTPTTFYVDVTAIVASENCTATLSVFVDTLPNPLLELGDDISAQWGSLVTLNPMTNGVYFWWTPETGLSCTSCPNPTVNAQESSSYYLKVQGQNGCYSFDTITVFYDGSIYAPNSFSPDGNGVNDIFYVYGKDIVEFELSIFDRWGEELYYSDDMNNGWNGIYKGVLAKTEAYVWKVKFTDILGDSGTIFGTVTLIR